jgi:hypothetical protein
MSPIVNWYKVIPVRNDLGPDPIPGRVLVHGERTVKNGTLIEMRGVQYPARPKMKSFRLYRRHLFGPEEYTEVEDIPATFDKELGFGHVAASIPVPLMARHRSVLNRRFQFRDSFGNPSTDISTARFGHIEIEEVRVWGTAGTAGTIPSGSVKIYALIKPIKDPTIEVTVLIAADRKPSPTQFPERGYRDLYDLMSADIDGIEDDSLEEAVRRSLSEQAAIEVGVEPSVLEVAAGEAGRFVVEVSMSAPGSVKFALQGVCSTDYINVDEQPADDPVDDGLLDVIVSDVFTLTLNAKGVMVFE